MKITQQAASAAFDAFEARPDAGGWGYLGERRNVREAVAAGDLPTDTLTRLAELDHALATVLGTGVRAFTWADSGDGRRFADWALSQDDLPALDAVARYKGSWGGKVWRVAHGANR